MQWTYMLVSCTPFCVCVYLCARVVLATELYCHVSIMWAWRIGPCQELRVVAILSVVCMYAVCVVG